MFAILLCGAVSITAAEEGERASDDPWRLCGPFQLSGTLVPEGNRVDPLRNSAPMVLSADEAETTEQRSLLRGQVQLQRADQRVSADELRYDAETSEVQTSTGLHYQAGGFALSAGKATLNLDTETGELEQVELAGREDHARAGAARMTLEGPDRTRLHDFTYTTCDADAEAWRLRGSEIVLDEAAGFGTAYHTRIELGNVPVLYLPYIKFPITDRRITGFLLPAVSSSSKTGTEIRAPYYINLAPNYDMTLTPRLMSKRGLLLGTQFRYLTTNSNGTAALDWLPSDDDYNNEDRGLLAYDHTSRWRSGWQSEIALEYVTDQDYLEDFGDTLSISSTTHLENRADLNYLGALWDFRVRAQGYQTIDRAIAESDKPYRRVPQLTLGLRRPAALGGWELDLDSEWVSFDHSLNEHGARFDLLPSISYPMSRAWGYLTPRLSARHTGYELSNRAPGAPPQPERNLYLFSVDGGLTFERTVALRGHSYTQTLEPRLFYLRVPYENQDDLPVFDTTEPDFSFASLFRENRFSGADRVGDADQLTLALTSRLLDDASGREQLRASIGQIHYFRDRLVQLPGTAAATREKSDIIAELAVQLPHHWNAAATLQWDPDIDRGTKNSLRLQYRPSNERIFNFGYRFQENELEQTDLSLRWPFNPRWHGVARWNYSLLNTRDLETFIGVEYESCCWALRLVGRRFLNDDDGTYNSSVMLQLVLKGLAKFGGSVESVLERGILDYHPD